VCDKGPSGAQKNLSTESGNFYSELHNAYVQDFSQYSSILSNLHSAWTPILNGGINQQGFSPSELAALNSGAINSTAANYKSASAAIDEQLAARGGGNSFLPSGATAQIDASIATKAAQQLSAEQNQITQANYATGRQNFKDAAGALTHVATEYNPNATAGVAVGAGDSAFKQATQIYQENVANNAWKGQLINAGIGVAADFATGGLSGIFSAATKKGSGGDVSGSTNPYTEFS
jgi:hypothetical protein